MVHSFNGSFNGSFNPGRKKRIPEELRHQVWMKQFGNVAESICPCCNITKISTIKRNYEAGHIKSEKNGGETSVNNLIPICRPCNQSMGSDNWDTYVLEVYGLEKLRSMSMSCKNNILVSGIIFN